MNAGFLVQGLRQNTLVAGKTTALRITIAPWSISAIAGLHSTITRPDGSLVSLSWSAPQLVSVDAGTDTEGIVVLIPGDKIPYTGQYYIRTSIVGVTGSVIGTCIIDAINLLPTKDLRMMVNRVWSNTGPAAKPREIEAAIDAMARLAAIYPIRDGISSLNGNRNAGLRYNFDNDPQGPPNQDGDVGDTWDPFEHPDDGEDGIYCALLYRFQDAGEGNGARTRDLYNGWLKNAGIVWNEPLGHVFAHETGHHLGLVNSASPHFDPSGQASHSLDSTIDPNELREGFDIQFNRPFPSTTFDIMFPSGPSPGLPHTDISLNSWDWEFMRNTLLESDSTGPSGPILPWHTLRGRSLRPTPSAIRNRHTGALEVFVIGGNKSLYHIREEAPGGNWSPWGSLRGHNFSGPIVTATHDDGTIQVFVLSYDGMIYSRAQNLNGTWEPWFNIGGHNIRGFAVSRNLDGRLEMMAVFDNGILYNAWQIRNNTLADRNQWSGWADLGGHDLKGPVALAPNEDNRLEVFVVGGDGQVYHRWQTSPNGTQGWSPWVGLFLPDGKRANDLRSELGAGGRIFVIIMKEDKSISYFSQVGPNGGWAPAVDLFGHDLQWPCGLGRADDGRLEICVIGGDKKVYSKWQVDSLRPDLWSPWTLLGGHDVQPGVALAANNNGQIEIFLIGGNGHCIVDQGL